MVCWSESGGPLCYDDKRRGWLEVSSRFMMSAELTTMCDWLRENFPPLEGQIGSGTWKSAYRWVSTTGQGEKLYSADSMHSIKYAFASEDYALQFRLIWG